MSIKRRLSFLCMNSPVIANEVKQSMTPNCMDCHASLAVTLCLKGNLSKQVQPARAFGEFGAEIRVRNGDQFLGALPG